MILLTYAELNHTDGKKGSFQAKCLKSTLRAEAHDDFAAFCGHPSLRSGQALTRAPSKQSSHGEKQQLPRRFDERERVGLHWQDGFARIEGDSEALSWSFG